MTLDKDALWRCLLHRERRLGVAQDSPYAFVSIPTEELVSPIEACKSPAATSAAAKSFVNGLPFFVTIPYTTTIPPRVPKQLTDFYLMHT